MVVKINVSRLASSATALTGMRRPLEWESGKFALPAAGPVAGDSLKRRLMVLPYSHNRVKAGGGATSKVSLRSSE
jgi:hypothetical protein